MDIRKYQKKILRNPWFMLILVAVGISPTVIGQIFVLSEFSDSAPIHPELHYLDGVETPNKFVA